MKFAGRGTKLYRRIAGWLGYELIKKRKLNHTLEQHLANVLEVEKINLVVDVGANVRQYARSVRLHGYAARIVSFEPVVAAFAALKLESDLDPNWLSCQIALGAERRPRSCGAMPRQNILRCML